MAGIKQVRLVATGIALAVTASSLIVPSRAMPVSQSPVKIYTLFSQQEFTGAGCLAGWNGSLDQQMQATCSGNSVYLQVAGTYRTSPIIWRNDLFPATGNLAIEVRFRYPTYNYGYGQDAFTVYDRPYAGQRLADDGMGHICDLNPPSLYWVDPGNICNSTSGAVLGSHAAGQGAMLRVDTSYDNLAYTIGGTSDWFIAVYEYTAATGQWRMWVDRNAPANGDLSQPWAGPFDASYGPTAIEQGRPVGLKIGHHIRRTVPGGWNTTEVDYIRVWRWDEATPTPTPTQTPTPTPPASINVQPNVCVEPAVNFVWSIMGALPPAATPAPCSPFSPYCPEPPPCASPFCSPIPTPAQDVVYPWELWRAGVLDAARTESVNYVSLRLARGWPYRFRVWARNPGGTTGPAEANVGVYPRVFNLWSSASTAPGGCFRPGVDYFVWGYEGMAWSGSYFTVAIRRLSDGVEVFRGDVGRLSSSFTPSGLEAGVSYRFYVNATGAGCPSAPVTMDFTTCAPTPTPTPTATPTPTPTATPTPQGWTVDLPGGGIFIHAYEPGMAGREQDDFPPDAPIQLEIQRWAGLAPIYNPANPPRLCTGVACYNGVLTTTQFIVSGIYNQTGTQPTFEYPNGTTVAYLRRHTIGDTNYQDCEYLWLLVLSRGGQFPREPAGCPQAIARIGYPGTYRVDGTLHLEAAWNNSEVSYVHRWSIPVSFWVAINAPYPLQPAQ